jgi:hypothetical protein
VAPDPAGIARSAAAQDLAEESALNSWQLNAHVAGSVRTSMIGIAICRPDVHIDHPGFWNLEGALTERGCAAALDATGPRCHHLSTLMFA